MYKINKTAQLTKYLVENTTKKIRPTLLILPGGAYMYTSPREAKPVATAFNAGGIHAFVLEYTTYDKNQKTTVDQMIGEVKAAYDYIISNAQEFQIDINKIYIIGFSAGGHLAAEVINKYPHLFARAILAYPALNLNIDERNQAGEEFEFIIKMFKNNPTNQITKDNPPVFIWHTVEDETVPIIGSIEYIKKLEELKIPYEAHFYETGQHGLSVANEITAEEDGTRMDMHAATWVNLAINWLLK